MLRLLTSVYGILTTIALLLGFVVAIVFITALLIGPNGGNSLALFAGEIMTWGIVLAAISLIAGLIYIYATGSHSLKMEKPAKPNESTE